MRTCTPADPKALEVAAQDAAALLEFWHARGDGQGVPAWSDFDVVGLRQWLGDINLIEAVDDGNDFFFRIYGTRLAEAMGFDMTGKRVSQLSDRRLVGMSLTLYRTVLAQGAPQFMFHRAPTSTVQRYWLRLAMPVASRDGRVDRVLGFGQALIPPARQGQAAGAATVFDPFPAMTAHGPETVQSLRARYLDLPG